MISHPLELLTEIRQMVRFGLYADAGTLAAWETMVAARIGQLNSVLEADASRLSATDTAQLVSLTAEFHDLIGRENEARAVLNGYISPSADGLIESVINIPSGPPRVDESDASGEELYARWIRQIAWLHMQYAWVCLYRAGKYEATIAYLSRVLDFMIHHLISSKRPSHGSLYKYFYYRAHAERSLRRFDDSLDSFMRAQDHAKQRYLHKKEKLRGKVEDEATLMRVLFQERRFAVICTARILGGGLAWNATHKGQLAHAQHLCLSAETLLIDTGQEPLRAFLRSNFLIAKRRATPAPTPDNQSAVKNTMTDLVVLYYEYKLVGDTLGQLRCGMEYVRGHVDFLAYWPGTEAQRNRSKRVVNKWLEKLLGVAQAVQDQAWQFRVEVLRLRFRLLTETTSDPKSPLEAPIALNQETKDVILLAEQDILCAMSSAKAGDYKEALHVVRRALDRAQREQDPVIEAECHLLIAQIHFDDANYPLARQALREWNELSRVVENAFLHRLAHNIERLLSTSMRPFIIRVDDSLNWHKCEEDLRLWLAEAAKHRAGANAAGKAIAELLGVTPSSWSRWYKKPIEEPKGEDI